jgi:hypothetical protein
VKIRPGHPLGLSPSNRLLAALLGTGRDPQQGAAVFAGKLAAVGACRNCSGTALPVVLKVRQGGCEVSKVVRGWGCLQGSWPLLVLAGIAPVLCCLWYSRCGTAVAAPEGGKYCL